MLKHAPRFSQYLTHLQVWLCQGYVRGYILIFLSGTVRVSSLVAAPHLRQPTGEMHESPTPVPDTQR